MPARVIHNNHGDKHPRKAQTVQIKAPLVNGLKHEEITQEMEAVLNNAKTQQSESPKSFSTFERAQFYAGHDRLNLQGGSVQRVRELQEENDHLQREITAKEEEIADCTDPLVILADIEHRKVMIARNTGEILKIYLRNEERIKRIKELQTNNTRIQNEMMTMQGHFISTKDMGEKTKFASEFFILKSEIERNLQEINELNKK